MLALGDPRWRDLKGGYRQSYDASEAIRRLLAGGASEELWEELCGELHHQGDVDQASYAAVPWLVEFVRLSPRLDWNALALIAVIELERARHRNPKPHKLLAEAYRTAIRSLPAVLGGHPDQDWGEETTQYAAACIALARGQRWLARAYFELDRETAGRWLQQELGRDFGED